MWDAAQAFWESAPTGTVFWKSPAAAAARPRIANRMLKRVRDFAQVRAEGTITYEVARDALNMLNVDELGLDRTDRNMLATMMDKFGGGPVGLDTLAATTGEDAVTIGGRIRSLPDAAGLHHAHAPWAHLHPRSL